MTNVDLRCGDAIELLRTLPDCSVDAVVTDPDYELIVHPSIKLWGGVPKVEWAAECLRVLKPGGHLLAFGGSRTYHRLAVAVEDAGFEIRDSLIYLYGSGFPKSHNIGKAIDKAAGAEREVIGPGTRHGGGIAGNGAAYELPSEVPMLTAPATDEAKQWDGWGSALKPGHESIVLAQKPFKGTIVANVLEHGTGGLNIDACRIATADNLSGGTYSDGGRGAGTFAEGSQSGMFVEGGGRLPGQYKQPTGRWPANVILDEDAAAELDAQTGTLKSGLFKGARIADKFRSTYSAFKGDPTREVETYGDSGGASRFFTTVSSREGEASADRRYTDSGSVEFAMLPGQRRHDEGGASRFFYTAKASKRERPVTADGFKHPTVKPLSLMRWLVRLVTPPSGVVLDPFAGSGPTVEACLLEEFDCIAFDIDPRAIELCQIRIDRNRPDVVG